MNPIIKNILLFVSAVAIGMIVSIGLTVLFSNAITPLDVTDPSDPQSIKDAIQKMQPKDFLLPTLARAIGTLMGAFFAARFADIGNMKLAMGIGFFFLIGGVAGVLKLDGPMWFSITEVSLAYLPMAWIGGKLGLGSKNKANSLKY